MTICIAATANNNSAVVVASDMMISAGFLNLEFDHPSSKIEQLGQSCVGLSAGDALPAGELFSSAYSVSATLQNPPVEQISETIKEAYCRLREKRIEETVFKPRGVTIHAFYQNGLIRQFPPEVAMSLDDQVQRMEFGVTLIVAGVDQSGAHIFCVSDPGISTSYDRIGYHAIGSGMTHAILSLVASGQHRSKSINETAFNVFRAKRQAELAPGVGNSLELRIITDGNVYTVTSEQLCKLDEILHILETPQNEKIHEDIANWQFDVNPGESTT